jgi:hypothetical protein
MLSDEEMVQRRNMHHTASDSAPFSVCFLIANARLEFSVSHRKDSPLKIPNRERIAIFHLVFRGRVKTAPALSFREGHGLIRSVKSPKLGSTPLALTHPRKHFLATRHSPLTIEFLIETFKESENQSSGWKHGRKQNSSSYKKRHFRKFAA